MPNESPRRDIKRVKKKGDLRTYASLAGRRYDAVENRTKS
jgi:hypothetical protein